MNPVHIYFKEIDIDQNHLFTINFAKENKIENILFDGQNEYAVSRMDIKPVIKDEKIIKIENKKEQKKISKEIQELIKIKNRTWHLLSHIQKQIVSKFPLWKKMKQNYRKRNWLF